MLTEYFHHQILRNITVAFGSLFNNIYCFRYDENGNEIERIKVPIMYGPKEKWLSKNISDPDLHKVVAVELPRMSFQRTGSLTYAPERKLNRAHKNIKTIPQVKRFSQFTPVPYDIPYELNILSKNAADADQIIEQILPFFTPSFDITINPIPDMDFQDDIPIILTSVTETDDYTGDFINRRALIWTLNFNVKANFYGPIKEQGVIRKTQIDIGIPVGGEEITDEQIRKTPRVIRHTGTPDPLNAEPTDDYGYDVKTEFFQDNSKYNPVTGNDEPIEE